MTQTLTVPTVCPDCESTDLTWNCAPNNLSTVVDGRLRLNETDTVFFLGCEACGETLVILDSAEIVTLLNGGAR